MLGIVRDHIEDIARLCEQYNVKHLELFGSALRAEGFDPETGDIDFLVEFLPLEPRKHAKSYFALLEKLQDMFLCEIDLVETAAITNPYFLESINKNRSQIYAA